MPPAKKPTVKKAAVKAKAPTPKAPKQKSAPKKAAPPAKANKAKKVAATQAVAVPKAPARATEPRAAPPALTPVLIPDTSVLVDGRVTLRIQQGDISRCRILIPNAAVAELERQANMGRETGFAGLDEVVKIQELKDAADLDVSFAGPRPTPDQIGQADTGEVDAIIRQVAVDARGKLLTSDRVQAHVARALGLDVEWIRPITEPEQSDDVESLGITSFFDDETMSVHLKQGVVPMAKKGTPAGVRLVTIGNQRMELRELTRMRREIVEAAKRDENSFIEIERHGATVVQLRAMRIAIAQPPFSDAVEITAVRPVAKLSFDEYDVPLEVQERLRDHQRGVFVSGAPGSGKSTFVTAVAEWLKDQNTIVKTMESPRDLQVSDDITQYGPLDGDMALTSDVLLLVRPDFVVYDEVRKTSDFETFADMRLAGVGLVGVTHANRAIDAIQRLIGRVELGMIPQVVDTVVHIDKGAISQVLELAFTVKTPAGMTESDLARPVIEIRDFLTKEVGFEIYTYGEQVVVMPLGDIGGGEKRSGRDRLASEGLKASMRRFVEGPFEVEVTGDNKATLYVPESNVPMIIGRGGANVKVLEQAVGMKVDVRPMPTAPRRETRASKKGRFDPNRPLRRERDEDEHAEDDHAGDEEENAPLSRSRPTVPQGRYAEVRPELRRSKKNITLLMRKEYAGERAQVVADDEVILTATVGAKGDIRISRDSDAGDRIMDALAHGVIILVRL